MGRAFRQVQVYQNVNSIPVLGLAPASGSLMVVLFSHWNNSPSSFTGWTQVSNDNGATNDGTAVFFKYATNTESTTQVPVTIGAESNGIFIEVTGVLGAQSLDILSCHASHGLSTTPAFTTGAFNSTANLSRAIAFLHATISGTGATEVAPIITTGWTNIATIVDNGPTGFHRHASGSFDYKDLATSGMSIQATGTWNQSQTEGEYTILELQWDAGGGGGGGGGVANSLRDFPAASTIRLFPTDLGRTFPLT